MGLFRKLDEHADLMDGMAERLGSDIAGRVMRDPVAGGHAYRAALLACATCREGAACAEWQARHDRAEAAPQYCRNAGWLEKLRP